jgi:penicillin-binding protein 1B
LEPGAELTQEEVLAGLRRAGYTASPNNPKGWFAANKNVVEVHPGPASYFRADAAVIRFDKDGVKGLTRVDGGGQLEQYMLEPELIANIVDGDREKRRLVRFDEIPTVLVQAVVSTEDKRFFEHLGFDPFRLAKAAYVDLKYGRKEQGASTLTMQLARSLWLDPEKKWRRKLSEFMITMVLEQRLTKQEIFEYYANQVYLGRRDSFSIHGFGEATRAYFDKDIGQLTAPEAALLAGMIQRPSHFNPFRYPQRAQERRNIVLKLMHENGYLNAGQYSAAVETPVNLNPRKLDLGDAPYFLALLNDELQSRLPSQDSEDSTGALQVYSTLDPDLQRFAVEAVRAAMPKVDKLVKAKRIAKDGVLPQVALVALDPHTGQVKAVVGGRNYSKSQLNHAISMRQPGSVFKPFVYAAALNTGIGGGGKIFTPVSTVVDEPTTFRFGTQVYEPTNFGDQFYGTVTLRRALAKSMNLATVSLAEKVGYDNVVRLARRCGLNDKVQATPAVALGAYEATPLEIAGAYTVFANRGEYVKPTFINRVLSGGSMTLNGEPQRHRALDPRVAFIMNTMLEDVIRSGTASGVRSQGFKAPAAGKTGTSRDGWFAGYTPDLLCIVWVGFDDNRELDLEGSKSALPVWLEFMKRAVKYHPASRNFDPPPPGVVAVSIDPYSGLLAGPECGGGQREYFIAGTEPRAECQAPVDDPFAPNGSGIVFTSGSADRDISGTPARRP